MIRYLETFYRHRIVLITPVVLALAVSLGVALMQPKTYEATARLWTDGSPVTAQDTTPPQTADQLASVLDELLQTQSFSLAAANRGPLAGSLSSASKLAPGSPALNDLIVSTMHQAASVTSLGPHILAVNFDAAQPAVAAGTAQALVDQFIDDVLATARARSQGAIDFYQSEVTDQATQLKTADAAVVAYLSAHPQLRTAVAVPDPTLAELQRQDDLIRQRYDDLLGRLDQARLQLQAQQQPAIAGFRLIDKPEVPSHQKGFLTRIAYASAAGLAVGLLVFALALMSLTLSDSGARRVDDIQGALARRVVATIPRVR